MRTNVERTPVQCYPYLATLGIMQNACNNEACWLRQEFMENNINNELLMYIENNIYINNFNNYYDLIIKIPVTINTIPIIDNFPILSPNK